MPEDPSVEVSELLGHWARGDQGAFERLVPLVYEELRRVAHHHLKRERVGHTLQSTALVHEAYMRLLGSKPIALQNRAHFIGIASHLIRQVLVDYARERRASKRDGGCRIELSHLDAIVLGSDEELLTLNDALDDLRRMDERQAQIVEMKFFGGLSSPEIAEVLGLSRATVDRDWATARVWLHRQVQRANSS
jgi:RNA polymerase sigma factor (TIGR02999 family)